MWRTLISASLVYGCGHPNLDGYRPALLDRALQSFHQEVNAAARDGEKWLASINDTRFMHYLKDAVARAEARLRSAGE